MNCLRFVRVDGAVVIVKSTFCYWYIGRLDKMLASGYRGQWVKCSAVPI